MPSEGTQPRVRQGSGAAAAASGRAPQLRASLESLAGHGVDLVVLGDFNLAWHSTTFTKKNATDGEGWLFPSDAYGERVSGRKVGDEASVLASPPGPGAAFVPVVTEAAGTTLAGTQLDQVWISGPLAERCWRGKAGTVRWHEHANWCLSPDDRAALPDKARKTLAAATGGATHPREQDEPGRSEGPSSPPADSTVISSSLPHGSVVGGSLRTALLAAASDHLALWASLAWDGKPMDRPVRFGDDVAAALMEALAPTRK